MVAQQFHHVRVWVFDLDNTLYPPEARLFDEVEARMTDQVMRAARVDRAGAERLRRHYRDTCGTTLAGLMRDHAIDPVPFLDDVHAIALDRLTPDPALAARIRALPGRRIVFTNGTAPYADRVTAARGLAGVFDALYGIEHTGYRPKPLRAAFDAVLAQDGADPRRAAMFEDDARNLVVPHDLGMRTVHVAPQAQPAAHVHHHTADLSGFLAGLGG